MIKDCLTLKIINFVHIQIYSLFKGKHYYDILKLFYPRKNIYILGNQKILNNTHPKISSNSISKKISILVATSIFDFYSISDFLIVKILILINSQLILDYIQQLNLKNKKLNIIIIINLQNIQNYKTQILIFINLWANTKF